MPVGSHLPVLTTAGFHCWVLTLRRRLLEDSRQQRTCSPAAAHTVPRERANHRGRFWVMILRSTTLCSGVLYRLGDGRVKERLTAACAAIVSARIAVALDGGLQSTRCRL